MKVYHDVQFTMSSQDFVEIMKEKIRSAGEFIAGIYNKADPTFFEKGNANFTMPYGYSVEMVDEEEYPLPEIVSASYNDCTWSVEFEFSTTIGKIIGHYHRPLGKGDIGKWHHTHEQFFKVFKDILQARSVAAELRRYK